jgi:hypothetical protein
VVVVLVGWQPLLLIKCFPNKLITLIESPNIPTVGVGESTIGQIRGWTSLLGIKDEEFIPYTDASYKLSIKFTDFYKKGEAFHYPFGLPNLDNNLSQLMIGGLKKCINLKHQIQIMLIVFFHKWLL